jgi:hypothetical protein
LSQQKTRYPKSIKTIGKTNNKEKENACRFRQETSQACRTG